MDYTNSISSASNEIDLPLGWKFVPSSYELLQYFLVPKLKGEQISTEYIRDLDVYSCNPDQLPLNQTKYARDDEGYFFVSNRRRNTSQIRTTPNGYWKIYKENVQLHGPDGAIGFKNKLEFYHGNFPNGNKTDWKMIEYMADQNLVPANTCNMDSYIVCKVKLKIKVEAARSLMEEEVEDDEDSGPSGEEISGTNGGVIQRQKNILDV